jgi:hypothetical protein
MIDLAPKIHELTHAERRVAYDDALERAKAAAHKASTAHKARTPDPRSSSDYRAWKTMKMVCVLLVKHQDKAASIECSKDGASRPRIFIPNKKHILLPESDGEFVLMLLPKWLAQKAELMGVTAGLSPDRTWTSAEVDQWRSLSSLRLSVNTKIHSANRRTPSNISRSNAA